MFIAIGQEERVKHEVGLLHRRRFLEHAHCNGCSGQSCGHHRTRNFATSHKTGVGISSIAALVGDLNPENSWSLASL